MMILMMMTRVGTRISVTPKIVAYFRPNVVCVFETIDPTSLDREVTGWWWSSLSLWNEDSLVPFVVVFDSCVSFFW